MKLLWLWFLARFRLDLNAVCEMSRGKGLWNDYHDYHDSNPPEPWHFHIHKCRRCGKEFYI